MSEKPIPKACAQRSFSKKASAEPCNGFSWLSGLLGPYFRIADAMGSVGQWQQQQLCSLAFSMAVVDVRML
jgi:hypothetical protein